jgi:hypothetical protein|tara:strand:+ start:2600 stop:3109 length:510 start_codon:yes stop_codon:yes gene_type:complete
MDKIWHSNFFIETDFKVDPNFWDSYFNNKWEDSNKLYSEYVDEATGGKEMNKFFVQEIHDYDIKLLRLIKLIWNEFGIRPKEFRCNFFKVLEGGELPVHVDNKSTCSFVIPITENTGELYFDNGINNDSILYDSMVVLNTKQPHGVRTPSKERIVFHMGVHDVGFDKLL